MLSTVLPLSDNIASSLPLSENIVLNFSKFLYSIFRKHQQFLIVQCDKNLGPAIIERSEYILLALRDHLSDATTYQRLRPWQIDHCKDKLERKSVKWLNEYKSDLTKSERKFIRSYTVYMFQLSFGGLIFFLSCLQCSMSNTSEVTTTSAWRDFVRRVVAR